MGENPILYSDLIKDDGSIDNLIAKLEEVISKYDSLVRKVQKEANETANSLKNVSGASEEQRKQIENSIQTQEDLLDAYKNWVSELRSAQREEQKLKVAKKESVQMDKTIIQYNNAKKGSYNQLSAEYRLIKMRLNEMSEAELKTAKGRALINHARELYEQMSNFQKATGKYTLEVGHYQNAMIGLTGPLSQVTNAIQHLGNNMRQVFVSDAPMAQKAMMGLKLAIVGVIAVAVSLGKALADVVRTNAQFEQSNANLQSVLGISKQDMKALTDTALSLGRSTEWTASQVVQLQTELAKLGFGDASIIAMQKHVLAFATAVGADLGEAANMAGAAIRAFNYTSADSERVMGTLAVAVNKSALTFDRIKYAMGTVFPVAHAFGLEIEDATALLGALANAGFSAESAATATRNMLLNLADANGKLAKRTGGAAKSFEDILAKTKQLREEGADLSEVFELTDKRSVAAFNALIDGTEVALELREQLNQVNGELKRIQQTRLDTVTGQTTILKSYWEGFKLSIQESNGFLKQTIVWLQEAVKWANKLFFPQQIAKQTALDKYMSDYEKLVTDWDKMGVENIGQMLEDRFKNVDRKAIEQQIDNINKEIARYEKQKYLSSDSQARKGILERTRDELLGQLSGMEEAYNLIQKRIILDEQERQAQIARTRQEAAEKEEQLSKEQKAQRIKDLQARIEQIKMEITYTEKGTQEMLNKRLELVEAERNLEIEKNAQAEETAKKDIAVINAKYNNERLETEKNFWKEISNLRIAALQADKKAIDDEISLTQDSSDRMLQLRLASLEKQRDIEIEQNKQKDEKVQQSEETIRKNYWERAFQLEADFLTKRAQMNLQAYQELEASEFALLDRNERQKTEFRLQQERERLQKILEINSTATEQMSEAQKQAIENTIQSIDKEIKTLPYNNIYELFGIGLNENQQDSLNAVWSSTKSLLGDIIDSYEKMADASVKAADKQVESAQKVLDAEIEAQKNGYANRVESAQKELELAQKNREKALRQQEKAKRAQIALDSIEQSSSLITASANIWKSFSSLGPWGIAAAIAGIATMWSSFAFSKVKAIQATKQEYGEGTVELLEGGSHASGNDIDLGYDRKKHKHRRAEGGEYFAVINRRNSRKYRNVIPDVIKSFNDGTFADKYQKASQSMGGIAVNIGSSTDVSALEKNVKAIKEQGERQIISSNDRVIVKYKNLTQTIKK